MGKTGRRIRGRRWGAAALVVLVAVAATGTWMLRRGGDAAVAATQTATVSTQTIKTTVAASGTVAAAATADLDFDVSGTVTAVLVKEGARVRKGQALARVDDASLVASRRAARLTLEAAQTQRDDDVDDDADDTQLAADRTAIVTARDGLASAQQAVEDATLTASIAGTVTSVGVSVGDVVASGSSSGTSAAAGASASGGGVTTTADTTSTSAVSIVSTDRFVVDATVASTDVTSVKKGMQAAITVTGVTDPVYGTVSSIGAVAETGSSGAAVFPVTIAVTGARTDVFAGVPADATITVEQVPDVLTVSTRALQTDGDTTYVEKVVDGQDVRTTVTTGEVYGMDTQVKSGLVEGDVVELPGFTTPAGGTGTNGGSTGGFPGGGTGGFPAGGTGGTGGFPGGGTAP